MSAKNINKLKEVSQSDLCTRCGTCVGLSGEKMFFDDKLGQCLPKIQNDLDENTALRLWQGCSALDVSFPQINQFVFGADAFQHPYLGHYRSLLIGNCTNDALRRKCSSGGIITRTLLFLLETKRITGAVVLGMDPRKPWETMPFIAKTSEEIISAGGSKYYLSPVNVILNDIEKHEGPLAYVGLPCQVHSIQKLRMAGDPSVSPIKYILGPFCGNNLYFSSVMSFLRSKGVKDYRKIKKLEFRAGEWPGHLRIEIDSDKTISLPKFHANYLVPFYICERCLLCTDLTNEFADISVGDAWSPIYEERGKGFSFIIPRSKIGYELLRELENNGKIELVSLTERDAIAMHTHGYDFKKRGAFIRIKRREKSGKLIPNYGYKINELSSKRLIFESILNLLFAIFRTYPARWSVERIPLNIIGKLFVTFRALWKNITRNIKTEDLLKE